MQIITGRRWMINNKIVIFLLVAPLACERHKWQPQFYDVVKIMHLFRWECGSANTLNASVFSLPSHFALSLSFSLPLWLFLLHCHVVWSLACTFHTINAYHAHARTQNTRKTVFFLHPTWSHCSMDLHACVASGDEINGSHTRFTIFYREYCDANF